MTVVDVAERLGCSRANVYALISRGFLPVVCVGRSKGYRIDLQDLERFIEQRKVQYEPPSPTAPYPQLKHIRL